MKASLLASSHYLHAMGEEAPPSLEAALNAACRTQHRRVDRFIQLALLGAARCCAGQSLDENRFLYLGSGAGPVGNNIVVQEQLCRERLLPRPFNFVNTLGSSATFYVAKELGLSGQAWWGSRRGASLEALLELALADLALGLCTSALIGVVEECPAPYADQCSRLGLAPGTALAEGSHWLLLGAAPERASGSQGGSLGAAFDLDGQSLLEDFRGAWRRGDSLAVGPGIPKALAEALSAAAGVSAVGLGQARHDSLAAAALSGWLQSAPQGRLHLLCGLPGSYARLEAAAR